MTELYVERVMGIVTKYCQDKQISEGLFWDWLGNVKFKEDGGNLTPERASLISQDIASLSEEYIKEVTNV